MNTFRRLSRRLSDSARMAWKRALSFRKQRWAFEDYPIVVRRQRFDGVSDDEEHESRYWARILGWLVDGTGPTRADAIAQLRHYYEIRKQAYLEKRKTIPRPGTKVPIEFACQERVDAHTELAGDFIRRVLQLEWALVTDESSLWDFTASESIKEFQDRVFLLYGAAIYDVESGNIAEILERIAAERAH